MEFRRDGILKDIAPRTRAAVEKNFWIIALAIIGAVGRITLSILLPKGAFDMFALIALLSLSAGYATRRWAAMLVPIGAMMASDIFIYALSGQTFPYGSASIILLTIFVWTGFAMMAVLGKALRRTERPSPLWFTVGGVWSVIIFDTWTNTGWWLLFYPNTIQGLAMSMTMGLPFMLWHMVSTLAFVPAFYIGVVLLDRNILSSSIADARETPDVEAKQATL